MIALFNCNDYMKVKESVKILTEDLNLWPEDLPPLIPNMWDKFRFI